MYSILGGTGAQRELGEVERGWGGEQPREEQSRNCSAAQVGLQSPSAASSCGIFLLSSSQVLMGIDQLSWAKSNEDEMEPWKLRANKIGNQKRKNNKYIN